MKLSKYMQLYKMKDGELARAIGKCRTAVLRYRHGVITPPVSVIAQIEKITNGKVTYEDFIRDEG